MGNASNIFDVSAPFWSGSNGDFASQNGNLKINANVVSSGITTSGIVTSGFRLNSGNPQQGYFMQCQDTLGNGAWVQIPAPRGVTGISITGQNLISGAISFIPSGSTQMAYSGNNIIIGNSITSGISAYKTITGSYSVTMEDSVIYINSSGSGNLPVITLMPASQVPGRIYTFKKIDVTANAVIISGSGVQTIDGSLSFPLVLPYQSLRIQADGGTSYYVL